MGRSFFMCGDVLKRLAAVGAVMAGLGAPGVTQAQNFFARSMGSMELTDAEPPVITGTMSQFFILFKGPAAFESLEISFEITQGDTIPDAMTGMFTFVGVDAADSLSGVLTGMNYPNEDGEWTGGGLWSTVSGTGAFAAISGGGEFSYGISINGDQAATAFSGTLVPAPASGALIGLMVFAGRRRRAG